MKLTSSLAAAMLASLAFTTSTTHASTSTWTGTAAGTYNWSTDATWDTTPASDLDTILNHTSALADSVVITSNNDVASPPFKLNQLSFTNVGPATGTAPTLTLTGNQLEFVTNTALATPTLTFSTTGAVKPKIDIQNNLLLTNVLGVTASTDGTLSGVISGEGSLTKTGSGTITLSGANTFTGGLILNGGTVISGINTAAAIDALGVSGGVITVDSASKLNVFSSAGNFNTTTLNKSIVLNANLSMGGNTGVTITGAVSGTGNITPTGGGSPTARVFNLTSTSNTFTGAINAGQNSNTTVNSLADATVTPGSGNIFLGIASGPSFFNWGSGAISSLTLNNRQIVLSSTTHGGTVTNANATVGNIVTINSNLGVTGVGAKTLTLGGVNTGENLFAGNIADGTSAPISVTKANSGKWILSGTNTYSGGTTINGGELNIATASSLGSSGNLTFSVSGTFGGTAGITYDLGALAINSGTATILAGDSRNYTFTTLSGSGALMLRADATLTTTLTVPDASAFTGGIEFRLGTANNYPNLGVKVGSLGDAPGAGNIQLSMNNVNKTGTFTLYNDVGPLTLNYRAIQLVNGGNGAALALVNSNTNPANTFVINTDLVPGTSAYAKKLILQGANTGNNTFAGVIANTTGTNGTVFVTKADAGTWILSGLNTYTGVTTISGGTLALGASGALPSGTAVSLGNATLDAGTSANSATTLDVTGAGTITLGNGATLAFANSSGMPWTGGTLNIVVGALAPTSIRFGTSSAGLSAPQLSQITVNGTGPCTLDINGYLVAPGFAAWQSTNSTAGAFNQDHDDDGVSNGVEYFLGGTGLTTGFTPLPPVVNTAGVLSVTWTKAGTYTGAYNTDFVVETSGTLVGTWTTESVVGNVTISGNDVKYTFPAPLGSKRFARLRVTGP